MRLSTSHVYNCATRPPKVMVLLGPCRCSSVCGVRLLVKQSPAVNRWLRKESMGVCRVEYRCDTSVMAGFPASVKGQHQCKEQRFQVGVVR